MFIDLPEHTPEWHEQRSRVIGGSEIAGLFGKQPDWGDSAYTLYHVKSGAVQPKKKSSGRAAFGTLLEPVIAKMIATARGWTIRKGRYALDDITSGMGASLDYEILDAGPDAGGVRSGVITYSAGDDDDDDDAVEVGRVVRAFSGPLVGPGILEIKQVDARQYREAWSGDEPPEYVLLQLQHEIACAGYKWGVVVGWRGGNDLRCFFYPAREAAITEIRSRIAEHWQRVRDKQPPPIDGSEGASRVLEALHPRLVNTEAAPLDLTDDNELPEICAEYLAANAVRRAEEKREDALKNRIKEKMGLHTHARTKGFQLWCSVTPPKPKVPPRMPAPGEMTKEVRRYTVKEDLSQ